MKENGQKFFLYFLINVFIYILPCFKTDLRRLCRWLDPISVEWMNIQYCYLSLSTELVYKIFLKKVLKWLLRYATFIQLIVRGKFLDSKMKHNVQGQATSKCVTSACRLFPADNNQGPIDSGRNFDLPPYLPKRI